jgi:hypothetical protein
MPKCKRDDSESSGGSDRPRNSQDDRGCDSRENNSQLDKRGTRPFAETGECHGENSSESVESSGSEPSQENSEFPSESDPLESRSVSLKKSQWDWLESLRSDHSMKSISVFLRNLIDKLKNNQGE